MRIPNQAEQQHALTGWRRWLLIGASMTCLMGNFTAGGCQDTWELQTQPADTIALSGGRAVFTAYALVAPLADVAYRWQKSGVDIVGSTASVHEEVVTFADQGARYRVIASSAGREDLRSAEATLTVVPWRFVASGLAPFGRISLAVGQSQLFTASVERVAETLTYQWLRNGQPIPGATGETYALGPVTLADQGVDIAVAVSHPLLTSTSAATDVTVTR
jgi:beta-galactosidase